MGMNQTEALLLPGFRTWYAALITACNYRCSYCTFDDTMFRVTGAKRRVPYPMLKPAQWIEALNAIGNRPDYLIFTGGEPTLYSGFCEVLKGLRGYAIKINTNLSFDVDRFIDELGWGSQVIERCYASYHPEYHVLDSYLAASLKLRESNVAGEVMINIMARDNTVQAENEQHQVAERFRQEGFATDYGRTDFGDEYLQSAFRVQRDVLCDPGHIMFAPNGDIYDCLTKMYKKEKPRGNIWTRQRNAGFESIGHAWIRCSLFGQCNACQEKRQLIERNEFDRLTALSINLSRQQPQPIMLAPRNELQPMDREFCPESR
jgi:MoaA/NifB/PqqE/SkfB family radical SAM enzyme